MHHPGKTGRIMTGPEADSTKPESQSRLASFTSRFPPIFNKIRRATDVPPSSTAPPTRRQSPSPVVVSYGGPRSFSASSPEIIPIHDGKKQPPSRSPTLPSIWDRSSPKTPPDEPSEPVPTRVTRNDELVRRSDSVPCLSSEPKWREARRFLGHRRPKIFDKYKPVKSIGKGKYGTVFQVVERRDVASGDDNKMVAEISSKPHPKAYACKVVDLISSGADADNSNKALQSRAQDVINEIQMMAGPGSGHPNVQDIIDFAVEGDKAYIVSSLCRGGDLAQALQMRGCLCEEDARSVMSGVLRGLAHLHSRGVAHRDIKLENILLTDSKHDMSKVKIIDMGFAKQLAGSDSTPGADEASYNTVCGTPMYIAPEMIRPTLRTGEVQGEARYGTQADMWSAGVILYYLLSGCPPFEATADMTSILELFEDIEKAEYNFWDPVWETVSEDALGIIEALLEADPAERLTAEEALRHPWMSSL